MITKYIWKPKQAKVTIKIWKQEGNEKGLATGDQHIINP